MSGLVGRVELVADRDLDAGSEASLEDLFTYEQCRSKTFTVESETELGKTKLRVTVSKSGKTVLQLDAVADATKNRGDEASLVMLLSYRDLSRKARLSEQVRKGDTLTVAVELS